MWELLHRHCFDVAYPNKTGITMEGEEPVIERCNGNISVVDCEFNESRPLMDLGFEREEKLRNHVIRRYKCFKFVPHSNDVDTYLPFLERSNELARAFKAIGMDEQTPSGALDRARCYRLVGSKIEGHLRSIRANKVKIWKNYVANGELFVLRGCLLPAFDSL